MEISGYMLLCYVYTRLRIDRYQFNKKTNHDTVGLRTWSFLGVEALGYTALSHNETALYYVIIFKGKN